MKDKKDSGSHGDEKKDIGMKMWRSLEITSKQICKVDDMVSKQNYGDQKKTIRSKERHKIWAVLRVGKHCFVVVRYI